MMQRWVEVDQKARRSEFLFALPGCQRLAGQWLCDARDAPALHLLSNALLLTLPAAACTLLWCRSHALGLAYLAANYALLLQRFLLTLHITQHRRLFKPECPGSAVLNGLMPYLLAPLFGVPPGMYRPHHVVMHHVEDNRAGWDQSSTEPYQRDNLAHFFIYWLRFAIGGWFEVPAYALSRRRHDLLAGMLCSEAGFWLLVAALWRHNWVGTLWALLLPFAITSFLAMLGNWSQHAFVDGSCGHDTYRSTYNLVACGDNRRTYNDGYHVLHHLNSRLHWSEMPTQLLATLDEHDAHDALVFHSLGFFDVGLAVFTGRLAYLARHIVPCGPRQAARTHEQWVEVLRERLRPVRPAAAAGKQRRDAGSADGKTQRAQRH